GYSLNDTVVIYDRIREMLRRYKRMSTPELLNISVNSTLSRSIITHLTVTLALLALLLFGGHAIHSFIATMIFGVVLVGTYTSVFIAAPILSYLGVGTARMESAQPAGEMRLQWWRDGLGGEGRGEVAANPVAAALLASMARYRLPAERLEALVEARRLDLYDEPMASLAALDAYADNVSASLLALAARALDAGGAPEIDALAHHAGPAYAVTGLLKAFPLHAARG